MPLLFVDSQPPEASVIDEVPASESHINHALVIREELATPVLITIEAAIGTGKSTLLRMLEKAEPSWAIIQEPVDLWQSVAGKFNLLAAYYNDQERFGFSFQTYCILSRIEAIERVLSGPAAPVIVMERSWISDCHIFAKMLIDSGRLCPMEAALYEQWYRFATRNCPTFDGHVYLDASLETCMKRLRKRSREGEDIITAEYQSDVLGHHEAWLATLPPDRLCRIDVNDEFASNEASFNVILEKLHDYVAFLRRKKTHF